MLSVLNLMTLWLDMDSVEDLATLVFAEANPGDSSRHVPSVPFWHRTKSDALMREAISSFSHFCWDGLEDFFSAGVRGVELRRHTPFPVGRYSWGAIRVSPLSSREYSHELYNPAALLRNSFCIKRPLVRNIDVPLPAFCSS